MTKTILTACFVFAAFTHAPALRGQDEGHLRAALEGKRLTLQIDMPATSEGVDIYPGTSRPLNMEKYANRLKDNGVAIKAGEPNMITKVKVKDDMIEVHLGGGGYGTMGDKFGSWGKNKAADSGNAQQAKIANERTQALAAGSRFNLHYPNGVTPTELTISAIVHALQDYATFPPSVVEAAAPVAVAQQATPEAVPAAGAGTIRKGMSTEDVEHLAGKPIGTKTNGQLLTNDYKWQGGSLEADFFNGVLVAYRISSS
ncbi:MAG TPA: hypothetical protein VGO46_05455 [Gemmatimonadaceae bacterium]|jgi:hypothetical protein|nr:hypothetical protein [Gemmatimonadaceae bacterium]